MPVATECPQAALQTPYKLISICSLQLTAAYLCMAHPVCCCGLSLLQVLADNRLHADSTIASATEALVILMPFLLRVCNSALLVHFIPAAAAALSQHQWMLPPSYQLVGVVAGGFPLFAALLVPKQYHKLRDSLTAAAQLLLLVMLRQPLLAVAAAGGGTVPVMFYSFVAAMLLLLFRQRFCWAILQAVCAAGANAALLSADATSRSIGWFTLGAWAPVLLPVAVLPLAYLREHIDR